MKAEEIKLSEKQKEVIGLMREHGLCVNGVLTDILVRLPGAILYQLKEKGLVERKSSFTTERQEFKITGLTTLGKTINL